MAEVLTTPPPTLGGPTGFDRIGTALADPIRRGVLVALLDGPAYPSDLADALHTTRPNLSNHLACLRGCGLVGASRHGRYLHYRLASDDLAAALRALLVVAESLPDCGDHRE